jgi:hypothetical protein
MYVPLPTRRQPRQGQTWDCHVHTPRDPQAPWTDLGAVLVWLQCHKA